MNAETKLAIEQTVNRASNMLLTVVRAYEEYAKEISDSDSTKIFAHLRAALYAMEERAAQARSIQRNAVGAFSLDNEEIQVFSKTTLEVIRQVLSDPAPMAIVTDDGPPLAPLAPTPEKPKWVKPEGRLAGTKEPIYATPASTNKSTAQELNATADVSGFVKDAGFLDK